MNPVREFVALAVVLGAYGVADVMLLVNTVLEDWTSPTVHAFEVVGIAIPPWVYLPIAMVVPAVVVFASRSAVMRTIIATIAITHVVAAIMLVLLASS